MKERETRRADNDDFEDQDSAFEQELEKVGVLVRELKRPVRKRVFRCQFSEEEKKWSKKKDALNEANILKKFGALNFYDPDTNVMYTVHTGNMEYEARHEYVALGVKDGDKESLRIFG